MGVGCTSRIVIVVGWATTGRSVGGRVGTDPVVVVVGSRSRRSRLLLVVGRVHRPVAGQFRRIRLQFESIDKRSREKGKRGKLAFMYIN